LEEIKSKKSKTKSIKIRDWIGYRIMELKI